MKFKLPEAVEPVWTFVTHLAVGAAMLMALIVIEVLLAGFLALVITIPFAPRWLADAANLLEQVLFGLDLLVMGLFLMAEVAKLVLALVKEVRGG